MNVSEIVPSGSVICGLVCGLVRTINMEGDKSQEGGRDKKKVSWKCAGAGAAGGDEVLEYEVEEGNSTRRNVEEITMKIVKRTLKREEERKRLQRLKEFHDQYDEHQAKLEEWRKTIPEKKEDVTDDKFTFGVPGVRSENYFPLFLNKEQEARIEQAKENGRHKFATKGRFVPWKGMWKH